MNFLSLFCVQKANAALQGEFYNSNNNDITFHRVYVVFKNAIPHEYLYISLAGLH